MTRPTAPLLIVLVVAASFAACAETSGEIRGGDQEIDTSPPCHISCDTTEAIDAGTGATWTDLHRDLFSVCANAACHGSETGRGVGMIKCFDRAGCRASLIEQGWIRLPSDQEFPDNSGLVSIMRHCDDDRNVRGIMPREPRCYIFSRASMARVKAWLAAGAQDD